jgi:hypothetical protein
VATPSLNFVVSERVRTALESLPGLRFAAVAIERVISLPYAAGDFSFADRPEFRRNPAHFWDERAFRLWPDRPDLHAPIGPRYEVVVGNAHRRAPEYPEARDVLLPEPTGASAGEEAAPLCARMLEERSMARTPRGTAMTPEAFGRIGPYLDQDYYAVAEVEIG